MFTCQEDTMNEVGLSTGFTSFNQVHQTTNPNSTGSTAGFTMMAPMVMAVPVYPVMLMPAFMMAQPQMLGGQIPGQVPTQMIEGQMATSGGAGSGGTGGHVTANSTNSLQTNAGFGGGQFGYTGGVGQMPMMMSPVLMALGFPVMMFGGAGMQTTTANQTAAEPALVDGGVDNAVVVDDVLADFTPPPVTDSVPPDPAIIDVVPPGSSDSPTLPTLPIAEVSAADFSKYRLLETERKSESTLALQLTTQDGDLITLDFSQLDLQGMSRFNGKTVDGERVSDFSLIDDTERVVNMEVSGDLSAEEQVAIDAVLSSVIDVVQNFFSGDMEGAISKLKMMDFDGGQLAQLSLNMSMTKRAEISRGYHNGEDQLHHLKEKDAEIAKSLYFLGSEQKRLIEAASSVLDTPSAVKLIRTLMLPMLSEPFAELKDEIANNGVADDPAETVASALLGEEEVVV